jgi:branched-chain amino acid aminotransferase
MRRDAERLRVPFQTTAAELKTLLHSLIDANRAHDATLRVAVVRNGGGLFEGPSIARKADLIAFTADLNDWGAGVKLTYVPHGRHGTFPFAGAKVTSWAQNLAWYEDAHERGFDEVVLLNEYGEVSECTSANIFAVQDDCVWTPPLATSGCLPGVTRAILVEEIRLPGFTIAERKLTPSDLEASDQVFITSTTRDLLPVLEIDREPLTQEPSVLQQLREVFLRYRNDYVTARKGQNKTFAA